jgi:hypothetical protein
LESPAAIRLLSLLPAPYLQHHFEKSAATVMPFLKKTQNLALEDDSCDQCCGVVTLTPTSSDRVGHFLQGKTAKLRRMQSCVCHGAGQMTLSEVWLRTGYRLGDHREQSE